MAESVNSQTYETIYVLAPTATEDDAQTIAQKIDNVVEKFKGEIKVREDWGNKELSYPIQDFKNGRYVVLNYTGNPGVVEEIERHFRIMAQVIRYMTVALEPEYSYIEIKKQIQTAEEEWKKAREARAEKFAARDRDRGDRGDRDRRPRT